MNRLFRIVQMTALAVVFFVVAGTTLFLVERWDGGLSERWRHAPFTGSLRDETLAIELAALPILVAVLACWGVVRLLRWRSVRNEIDDTFAPVLAVVTGYGRFLLVVLAAAYLLMGRGWAAAVHLFVALAAWVVHHLRNESRMQAMEEASQREQEEGDDDTAA